MLNKFNEIKQVSEEIQRIKNNLIKINELLKGNYQEDVMTMAESKKYMKNLDTCENNGQKKIDAYQNEISDKNWEEWGKKIKTRNQEE